MYRLVALALVSSVLVFARSGSSGAPALPVVGEVLSVTGDHDPLEHSGSIVGQLTLPPEVLELGLEASLELRLVPRGGLLADASWRAPVASLAILDDAPDRRCFRFESVPEGDYDLLLHPLGVMQACTIVGGADVFEHVEYPPLARTILELEGEGIEGLAIHPKVGPRRLDVWSRRVPEPGAGATIAVFEILAPAGNLAVIVFDPARGLDRLELATEAGWNHHEWAVKLRSAR